MKILIALAGFTALSGLTRATPPNVLFILADDLGWSDTTLFGTTRFYQTPNVERLAKRGMTFTRAYSASPLCSPTRSAIITGLSPARTGITAPNCHLPQVVLEATVANTAAPNQKSIQPGVVTRLKPEYRTLAESLKAAGYATGHFGKWHLGPEPYSPLQQGFDVDVPHYSGPGPAGSYVAPWKFKDFDADPGEPNQHIEDRMAKEAVAFMEQHKEGPFYLNYWMFSVHAPFDAKKTLIEKHRARVNPADPQRSPTYAAMIESMDDAIGTLLDTLDRLKIADHTIIIFTSDNGGNMYDKVDDTTPTSNAPLRGGKATLFEGGTRVPCVIAWPGLTTAGSRSDAIIQSEDYYPTLLAGLGLQPAPDQYFDGINILPALKGGDLARDAVFQYFPHNPAVPDWLPPAVSVHQGDWKLIRIFYGGDNGAHRWKLFNVRDDPGEQRDLVSQEPARVKQMDDLIDRFLTTTKAVQPKPNPAFDPTQYHPEDEGKQRVTTPAKKKGPAKPKGSATANPPPDDPKLQGWKARGCTAVVTDGILTVTGNSAEPFLGFAPGKLNGETKLRFRIKCDGGSGKVAWLPSPTTQPADAPKPVEFTAKAGEWTEITAPIPAPSGQAGIVRLYLPAQASAVAIDWIEIIPGGAGKPKRADF